MSPSVASESDDLAVLAQALQDVLSSAGLPSDQMPSRRQLTRARRSDLIRQIRQAGGFAIVAERLGLARPHAKRPPGYWADVANLAAAMQSFLTSAGTPGMMPTADELVVAGYGVLNGVIRSYGGFAAVAVLLGLTQPRPKMPTGYWQDFTHVAAAIQAWIAAHGTPGMMPTWTELEATEDHALLNAIQQHGGMPQVATRVGLHLTYTRKPRGYWDDPANLDRDLRAWIAAHGTPGMMPTLEAVSPLVV